MRWMTRAIAGDAADDALGVGTGGEGVLRPSPSGPEPKAARSTEAVRISDGAVPPRPALPPVLGCALALWVACAATLQAARTLDGSVCLGLAAAGAACALGAAAGMWRRMATMAWAVLAGAALGVGCAGAFAASQHADAARITGFSGTVRFEALSDATEGPYSSSCTARVQLPDGSTATVRLLLPAGEDPLRYGEVAEGSARFAASSGESAALCWRQGAVCEARAEDLRRLARADAVGSLLHVRERALEVLEAHAERVGGDEGAGVAAALACGWRGSLDERLYDDFKAVGLAHLVAVSGAHLSLASAFASGVLRLVRAPHALASALQAAMLASYLVLAAMPASAVRAAAMAFAGLGAAAIGRRRASASALAACIALFVALSPQTALSASFALSALSTLGIVLFAGLFAAWTESAVPLLPTFAVEALALTFASSVAALPLSAALFSQVPLVSPLANVVASPLFGPVCAGDLALLSAAVAAPVASDALAGAACAASSLLAGVVRLLSAVPHASVPADVPVEGAIVGGAAAMAALWVAWPHPTKGRVAALSASTAAVVLAAMVALPLSAPDEIVMLDVGQGDAFLIRSQGRALLVDTGNRDRLLREALARHGIIRLDAVIVTHGDDDHEGSLPSLAGVVEVERVFVADDALSCSCDACAGLRDDARAVVGPDGLQGLSAGDTLSLGAFELRVLWPTAFQDEGGNADSLCFTAEADVDADGEEDWTALFTGDAERDQLHALLDAGAVGKIDVCKVGHHGSKNALDPAIAEELSPEVALVSVGANNRYGHPAAQTIEALENVGATVFRTDESGDVSCELHPDRMEVDTLR